MGKRTRQFSQETIRRMSEAHKGSRNAMFGRKHTAASKLKMSNAQKLAWLKVPKPASDIYSK